LRLAEVQQPKIAATFSFCRSSLAFSANVGQSDAPSWVTGTSCWPRTPPDLLISSMAMSEAFLTATSLIAMVPLNELSTPTLMPVLAAATVGLAATATVGAAAGAGAPQAASSPAAEPTRTTPVDARKKVRRLKFRLSIVPP